MTRCCSYWSLESQRFFHSPQVRAHTPEVTYELVSFTHELEVPKSVKRSFPQSWFISSAESAKHHACMLWSPCKGMRVCFLGREVVPPLGVSLLSIVLEMQSNRMQLCRVLDPPSPGGELIGSRPSFFSRVKHSWFQDRNSLLLRMDSLSRTPQGTLAGSTVHGGDKAARPGHADPLKGTPKHLGALSLSASPKIKSMCLRHGTCPLQTPLPLLWQNTWKKLCCVLW